MKKYTKVDIGCALLRRSPLIFSNKCFQEKEIMIIAHVLATTGVAGLDLLASLPIEFKNTI